MTNELIGVLEDATLEVNVTISEAGPRGLQGIQGPKGDKGEQGEQGPRGEKGDDGHTPIKDIDYFDGEDGAPGADGITPHIGVNGNWYLGETDTGVKADGTDGAKGDKGDTGERGEKGTDGKDGHTPQKGVDYYTDDDKAEMVSAVISALPMAEGVGF